MPGISQGSRDKVASEGLLSDIKRGDDAGRAIAQSILSVDATVASRLARVRSLESWDQDVRERLGVKEGICMDCLEEIPEPRMKAVPTATRCVSCQEKVEPSRYR